MKTLVPVPIYGTTITVCDDFTEQPTPDSNCGAGTTIAAVWHDKGDVFFTYNPNLLTLGGIVHESLHVANHIFEMKGIHADETNDEHVAYLMQWVFERLNKIIGLGGDND